MHFGTVVRFPVAVVFALVDNQRDDRICLLCWLSCYLQAKDVDIILSTMGTTLASAGGFCCGNKKVADHQVGPMAAGSNCSTECKGPHSIRCM